MKVTQATKKDLEFLIALRNEEVNVKHSKRGKLTPEQIKQDYFNNPLKYPYVVQEENQNIGYIIYELLGSQVFRISVALEPDFRGLSKGKDIIKLGTEHCLKNFNATKIIAEIYPNYTPSLKAFEAAEYKRDGKTKEGLVIYSYERKQ